MIFVYIESKKADISVWRACQLMGVSESGFYAWRRRPACQRQKDDMVLLAHIRAAFQGSNETYGSPRMMHELRDLGFAVGRRRTARLMRENGLCAKVKRRFKRTTDSQHEHSVAPNLLDQDFTAERPNQVWSTDISYIWTREGWLYLAIVMDLYSRRIVGWAVSDRLKTALPLEALKRAKLLRRLPKGLIHHSDRGSQYCFYDYRKAVKNLGAKPSMSGKGNCYDNAVVETFFKTIKSELVWRTVFQTRRQAKAEIAAYIDGFYNPVRRHSACNYTSPMKYEMIKKNQSTLHFTEASPNYKSPSPRCHS